MNDNTSITPDKQEFLNGLLETAEEINLAKQGTIKLKTADQLLDELE